ncbi:hypothetical protein ACILG0_22685 [Pseudomonadota bacterium AL_CKDN230030165-1A_HGKHYDSX7]
MSFTRFGFAAAASAAVLSGCAMLYPDPKESLSPELRTALDTPLICKGEAECKLMWERGIYYVANNSRWQMVAQTSNLIETDSVPRGSPHLSYSITREPLGGGSYRIATQAWCGGSERFCKPNAPEAIARAKLYMRTGQR